MLHHAVPVQLGHGIRGGCVLPYSGPYVLAWDGPRQLVVASAAGGGGGANTMIHNVVCQLVQLNPVETALDSAIPEVRQKDAEGWQGALWLRGKGGWCRRITAG
jgi:hypothetical protein